MVLGIDLGTCNTLAATISADGRPVLIPDIKTGAIITPSLIMLDQKISLVGAMAEDYMEICPDKNYIRYFKRSFGSPDPVTFDQAGRSWYSETLAAMVLKKIKFDAEEMLQDHIDQTVITVPAHYNDAQRKSVLEAAKLAGMELPAIIDEPVAAAISYMHTAILGEEIVMVYDFGGGTFDLTLITQNGHSVHVLAKDGLSDLGGKEFDEIIGNKIVESYEKVFHSAFPFHVGNVIKLRRISEKIKMELCSSSVLLYHQWLDFDGKCFEFVISHSEFAAIAVTYIDMTRQIVDRCLRSVGMSMNDVSRMIMVGGTSQIPLIKEYWETLMNADNQRLIYYDPMSSVARGAALYAHSLSPDRIGTPVDLKSVSTYNIGLRDAAKPDAHFEIWISKNIPLPASEKRTFSMVPDQARKLTLIQSWGEGQETFVSGIITLGPYSPEIQSIDLHIENRANGTIGIKASHSKSGKDLRFSFEKITSKYHYDMIEQMQLLHSVAINDII